jgi:putative FmdB family regulatory protein
LTTPTRAAPTPARRGMAGEVARRASGDAVLPPRRGASELPNRRATRGNGNDCRFIMRWTESSRYSTPQRLVTSPPAHFLPIFSALVPLYEFRCPRCSARFEALTAPAETPPCPSCGAAGPDRLFSPISRPLKLGLRGRAARRSDALRRVREERRREERARRQDERAHKDRIEGREERGRKERRPDSGA